MSVVLIMIPVALFMAGCAVAAFIIAAKKGQFDDLDTPAIRAIFDDDETPLERAAPQKEQHAAEDSDA